MTTTLMRLILPTAFFILATLVSHTLADSTLVVGGKECTASTSDGSHSWDLFALKLKSGYLAKMSEDDAYAKKTSTTYQYRFNVCANVSAPDAKCIKNSTSGVIAQAPAYQLGYANSSIGVVGVQMCKRLAADPAVTTWSLLDEHDPSKGLSVRYDGGDVCSSTGKPRAFILNFICAEDDINRGTGTDARNELGTDVDEGKDEAKCVYTIEFVTRSACPLECPIAQTGTRQLCNGGFCGYDVSLKRARCFCQEGLFGDDCAADTPPSSECTGTCLLLVFTNALLMILLLSGACVFWRVSLVIEKQQVLAAASQSSLSPSAHQRLRHPNARQSDDSRVGGSQRNSNNGATNSQPEEIELEEDDEDLRDM